MSTATLRFIKPESATDQDTITYRAQVQAVAVAAPALRTRTCSAWQCTRGAACIVVVPISSAWICHVLIYPTPVLPPALQLYDASSDPPAELGNPVALKIVSGAGVTGNPYVASLGPFAQPLRITVAVQATGGAGSVSTALSEPASPAVVVGELLNGNGSCCCVSQTVHMQSHITMPAGQGRLDGLPS